MVSSASFASWTKTAKNSAGSTFYVDYETVRKKGGYVYWWQLTANAQPNKGGDLSLKMYIKGDCDERKFRILSMIFYKQPMGTGAGESMAPKVKDWIYPPPKTSAEAVLSFVCSYLEDPSLVQSILAKPWD